MTGHRYVWLLVLALCMAVLMVALPPGASAGPGRGGAPERIVAAQERHTARLLSVEGVVGTAAGAEAVLVLVETSEAAGRVPQELDGVPVRAKVTGAIRALVDATAKFERPVPAGVSTGNAGECSAGTIACRVRDADGNLYALSNNHVYALENAASTGSKILQPGLYDTDCTFDGSNVIGTLSDFEPIVFDGQTENTIDAAIGATSSGQMGTATPADGYGIPGSETVAAELGQQVMKYGRTTNLTHGEVTGLNAAVKVGYSSGTALFVDQIIVEGRRPFIRAGDSGSLLVTEAGSNPVGLLFAGNNSGKLAVANPIGPVLDRFNVTVDDSPPAPVTDIAITEVGAPSSVTKGTTVGVDVTVANVGNQDVGSDIGVTLTDQTDAVTVGTQTVGGGLAAGASATLTFSWDTTGASLGDHALTAAHDCADDQAANDASSATVNVTEESELIVSGIAPGAMQAGSTIDVEIGGAGFVTGAQVTFEGGNGPVPAATVNTVTATSIGATVTAKSGGPPRDRVWDVRVTNPDGASAVLTDGFTVTP